MARAIEGMSTYAFQKCMRQLNPKLRICCQDTSHAAGLYYIDPVEGYVDVCGVDKKWVPVAAEVDAIGHILKSGWYRVVNILLARKLTTPDKVTRIWPGFFGARVPAATFSNADPILSKFKSYVTEAEARKGDQKLTDDQILEVAEDVRNKDTEIQKLERDKAKFDLDKATGKTKIYL